MLVVSDTSVLLNLCRVSAEDLLPELFREVWIPPAVQVAAEVRACPGLDAGESEALSLALEMQASAVLVDEAAARNAAKALKVVPIGIAGILLRAKGQGLIPLVGPLLGRLR